MTFIIVLLWGWLIFELLKEFWWIVLIAFGVLIAITVIIAILDPTPSGGYSSPPGRTGGSGGSSSTSTSSKNEGLFYKGSSASGFVTGTYRNGQIFDGYDSGLSMSFIKATYCDGYVYEGTTTGFMGNVIGRYENGRIYKDNSTYSKDLVAAYGDGNIYPSPSSYSITGKYTGDDEGGATAAIYFMFYK